MSRISIHAPARGATVACSMAIRMGTISIHAPARGATMKVVDSCFHCPISIHAPARGATYDRDRKNHPFRFQFTPLREGRRR